MTDKWNQSLSSLDRDNKLEAFFYSSGQLFIQCLSLEEKITEEYFKNSSFDKLLKDNHKLYEELEEKNYHTSYANPSYCAALFGKEMGPFLSSLYFQFRKAIPLAFCHNKLILNIYGKLLGFLLDAVSRREHKVEDLKKIYQDFRKLYIMDLEINPFIDEYDRETNHCSQVLHSADFSNLNYLFRYGYYVGQNEIETARFLLRYDKSKLAEIGEMIARAYVKGFTGMGKDISLHTDVMTRYNMGMEILCNELFANFKKHNLSGFYSRCLAQGPNKQYSYDHRFDEALYLDREYTDLFKLSITTGFEIRKKWLNKSSGIMLLEQFGDPPFHPQSKEECLKLIEEQNALITEMKSFRRQELQKYSPDRETSFCIVAFPLPGIGEQFEEIFEETCKINKMDSRVYEPIQQHLVDALDKGAYVHVKGKAPNKTDIKVQLQPLANPEKETLFENCTADVNIPLGEVFTTPQLKGTSGILHLETVFLDDLEYKNLELHFSEGMITDYFCSNFPENEDNKKYIEENLLFPHKTLALGEFAIGTNTAAYVMAQKYGITHLLPVLIVEKMGPHFAVGDTCYSWEEDNPVYNADGKEIISRDNEISLLRKTDTTKAYWNIHTDITLPYDGLDFISVITEKGEAIPLIKGGRFVLAGTEMLNEPFKSAQEN